MENGNICRLWKDPIRGDVPFCDKFTEIFAICQKQKCTIKHVVDTNYTLELS
jgi:hypothetical protein